MKPKTTPKTIYKPIVTLATATIINDKQESVLIPKVLCSNEELKSISDCMVCANHKGIPNQFTVACDKSEDEGDNNK